MKNIPSTLEHVEQLAKRLPPLLINALKTAETLTAGTHGRRKTGPGDRFYQYRHYLPGESAHQIDWRACARTQHLYIRETEWEAAQKAFFWVDTSPSMKWRSASALPTKEDRGQLLALALAALLLQGQELVASLDGTCPPHSGPSTLISLYDTLKKPQRITQLPSPHLPKRAHVIAVSDFTLHPEEVCPWLEALSAQGNTVLLLDIADPAEETFPFQAPTLFQGLEGEEDQTIAHPQALRKAYLEKRRHNQMLITKTAARCQAHFVRHVTNTPPDRVLKTLYQMLYENHHQQRGGF